MEGMKKMIVEEVNSFRSMVRAQARAAQGRKPDKCVTSDLHILRVLTPPSPYSLPIPTRDEIISSPIVENAPANGATSSFTAPAGQGPNSPILEDPSDQLEKELAGTHINKGVA